VSTVEVFDIDRSNWRVINYISNKDKLRVLHPGTIQITGKKIMIFGGLCPKKDEDDEYQALENGLPVSVSN
jgi:hypothetical protein